jgi:hypothetical protein
MAWRKREIMEMAREAGLHIATDVNWMPVIGLEYAEKFAKLVREDEREKFCAALRQLHDSYSLASDPNGIRARSEHG